jgi:hypothetical protein
MTLGELIAALSETHVNLDTNVVFQYVDSRECRTFNVSSPIIAVEDEADGWPEKEKVVVIVL